jgi:hypothetical protein
VLLGALALAGSASAATSPFEPYLNHTAIGGHYPIRIRTTMTPPVAAFGDAVTASVVVLADSRYIDPSRLRPVIDFALYQPIAPPTKLESQTGRVIEIHWAWKLRCLTAKCVPITPPSDLAHIFHFPKARFEYLDPHGKVAWTATARWPAVQAFSNISPGIVAYLNQTSHVKWQYQLTPAAVSYRISPALVFWIAVLLAGICAAAAIAITARWILRLRKPAVVAPEAELPSLERALALFFWAGQHGDETLQRKALERVAAELPFDVSELSDETRELAWSPELPEEDEVEAISERAGVPAHQEDGAGR